jgi:hypothetical protein
MSNCAYLIAGKTPEPAGCNGDGETNYDFQSDVIATGGGYQLPLFWLSLFNQADLCLHQFDEYRVPTVVCERSSAFANLRKRRSLMQATFPACEAHWASWEWLVGSATAPYFKLDATELWDLGPEEYERDFPVALRWFESGDAGDLSVLLSMGAFAYDAESKHLTLGGSEVLGAHLYGYRASPPSTSMPPPMPR